MIVAPKYRTQAGISRERLEWSNAGGILVPAPHVVQTRPRFSFPSILRKERSISRCRSNTRVLVVGDAFRYIVPSGVDWLALKSRALGGKFAYPFLPVIPGDVLVFAPVNMAGGVHAFAFWKNNAPHGSATLTASTTWTVPALVTLLSKVLLVGGGAGGGNLYGGGGGAGGYLVATNVSVTPSSGITVTIGPGGAGAPLGSVRAGSNGTDTTFGGYTGYGGGGGGGAGGACPAANGSTGGEGTYSYPPQTPGSSQGNIGGNSGYSNAGDGGGGAGAAGGIAPANLGAGNGGNGLSFLTFGTFAGGGGGGGTGNYGTGGSGGGGNGDDGSAIYNGAANTGGGGGGGAALWTTNNAGAGGSGIVIVVY